MLDAIEVAYNAIQSQSIRYMGYVYSDYNFFTVTISCDIDVTYFPFDTQICPIVFEPITGFDGLYKMGKIYVIYGYPGFGPDPNWAMIRPNRAHTPVFPERNYRVWKAVRAHNSLDHGLISVWSEVNLVWTVWS